jgi:excisionase family DNA binding protein
MMPADVGGTTRLLLTPEEAAHCLSIGRTRVYALLASRQLASIQIGRSRRIPLTELTLFIERSMASERHNDELEPSFEGGPSRASHVVEPSFAASLDAPLAPDTH